MELKKKLQKRKIKKPKEEMKHIDELADGPIMTKRYWQAIQKQKKKK